LLSWALGCLSSAAGVPRQVCFVLPGTCDVDFGMIQASGVCFGRCRLVSGSLDLPTCILGLDLPAGSSHCSPVGPGFGQASLDAQKGRQRTVSRFATYCLCLLLKSQAGMAGTAICTLHSAVIQERSRSRRRGRRTNLDLSDTREPEACCRSTSTP